MGYLVGDLLPRSARVFHFGFRTSKLGSIFEAPSDYTMLQGVHADPPFPLSMRHLECSKDGGRPDCGRFGARV
jgi:hypothetical protein